MDPKGTEADLESGEWVLDSLVGYLRSPAWQETLMKFLEDKSVGMNIFIAIDQIDPIKCLALSVRT